MTAVMTFMLAVMIGISLEYTRIVVGVFRCQWMRGGRLAVRTLDNFVQLTSIEPDSAAFRTAVDFDTLLFIKNKVFSFANGTFHGTSPP